MHLPIHYSFIHKKKIPKHTTRNACCNAHQKATYPHTHTHRDTRTPDRPTIRQAKTLKVYLTRLPLCQWQLFVAIVCCMRMYVRIHICNCIVSTSTLSASPLKPMISSTIIGRIKYLSCSNC
ncbi:unnamed protein product [Ceratitis capitata]|uniref:(Mediterranean fruit fly) hypothetical protein n=1 Tax=Ceratitis capitata TaxID=7213 RepID=A0A811UM91_CERCA|nr:unnamed protein product [Ceratitis capitata]